MTGFPDPPKPPLPPPPLPPLSSLMSFESRMRHNNNNNNNNNISGGKNNHHIHAQQQLPINTEREQLVYSRFLQNFIFKYNNRNLHKQCNKIDMSNLEYLLLTNENYLMPPLSTAAKNMNRFGGVQHQIGSVLTANLSSALSTVNRLATMTTTSSGPQRIPSAFGLNSEFMLSTPPGWASKRQDAGTSMISKIASVLSTATTTMVTTTVTSDVSQTLMKNSAKETTMITTIRRQFDPSSTLSSSSADESFFDFDEYLSTLAARLSADPWKFFFDTLLIPALVLFLVFLLVLIGILVKSCKNARAKKASSSSASSSSFIACYGTDSLGSTSVDNSIGINSTLLLTANLVSSSPNNNNNNNNNKPHILSRGAAAAATAGPGGIKTTTTTTQNNNNNQNINHVYYSESCNDTIVQSHHKKPPTFMQSGMTPGNKNNNKKLLPLGIDLDLDFNMNDDDDDDENENDDRSSSGKYYSIKSNNNFSTRLSPKSASVTATNQASLTTTAVNQAPVYPCLSTFGRNKLVTGGNYHQQQPTAAAAVAATRIKTNPTPHQILNVNNLKSTASHGGSELISHSLTNSSSHSVESAAASLTRSSNHYNEPDAVYFTSSYCRLVPPQASMDAAASSSTARMNYGHGGLEKTSSSKVFPRTNPMYRNYGGGSSLKLNLNEPDQTPDAAATTVAMPVARHQIHSDLIDVCSKL